MPLNNVNILCVFTVLILCAVSTSPVSGGPLFQISHARARLLTELPLFSAGNVFDVNHHLAKRQTLANYTTQDRIDCTSTTIDYQCKTSSGFAQHTIDVYLSCGDEVSARAFESNCVINENGDRCRAAILRFTSDQAALSNAIAACSQAATSGSCSTACRSFLESGKRMLGCCIGAYNRTGSSTSQLFDYRLWNLCNVGILTANCPGNGTGLSLSPPALASAQECTKQRISSRINQYLCTPSVGQPLVDALLENSRCRVVAKLTADVCGTNANDQICLDLVGTDVLGSLSSNAMLVTLANSCNSNSVCSSSCLSAMTTIKDAYGCCVNIYNNTDIGLQIPSLSYDIWNRCGVDSPGFCTSSLSTDPSLSTAESPTTFSPSFSDQESDSSEDPTNYSPNNAMGLFWISAVAMACTLVAFL